MLLSCVTVWDCPGLCPFWQTYIKVTLYCILWADDFSPQWLICIRPPSKEMQGRLGSPARPPWAFIAFFHYFCSFLPLLIHKLLERVTKEVLLSVSGTGAYSAGFCGQRKSRPKGKLLLGTFQGNSPRVAFWSWCLLQKMESYLTNYCYVLMWFSQHLQEKKSFSRLLIESFHPPPIGSTVFSPEKQHG